MSIKEISRILLSLIGDVILSILTLLCLIIVLIFNNIMGIILFSIMSILTMYNLIKIIPDIIKIKKFINDGDLTGYKYVQTTPSKVWNIKHNMDKFPSVTIVSVSGHEVTADVIYISNKEIEIRFSFEYMGEVYLN